MTGLSLPDLGEGLQEAEIVAWHVAEGDHVVADQPLVSVETEKAVVEIPSPQAGRIARLLAKPGETVKVGAPLVMFEEGAHADTGAVVGDLGPPSDAARPGVRASPAVRALARDRGIDLAGVVGTGPAGTITRGDIERSVAQTAVAGSEPLRGMRRSMARNMARAHAEVVPATLWDESDIEGWWTQGADVSVRLVRGIAAACGAVPALNAAYDGKAMARRPNARLDLGIAVDTEEGLVVPVLRDAASRGGAELRRDLDVLKSAARARSLAPGDLQHPTITLSNFGMLAGRQSALVIIPPQVAIIGAGRITRQAVPADSGFAFHHFLPLSLTFDHRAVTGGEAARFLRALIGDLERSN